MSSGPAAVLCDLEIAAVSSLIQKGLLYVSVLLGHVALWAERPIVIRDGPNVRLWHSAEAEGLGGLTERVPNVGPNFGRMLYASMNVWH